MQAALQLCNIMMHCITVMQHLLSLQVLKLVDPPLGVSSSDFPESLVLVPSLTHVLLVQTVHAGLFLYVSGGLKVVLQSLEVTDTIVRHEIQ